MKVWRIGSGAYRVFDGAGAALYLGRWNEPGQRVIYAGASFAIAMLERLCYSAMGALPDDDRYVAADIPDDVVELVEPEAVPGWRAAPSPVARAFGARWHRESRSLALVVPSAVTLIDRNVVINADHPAFSRIAVSKEKPVLWDRRLFQRGER